MFFTVLFSCEERRQQLIPRSKSIENLIYLAIKAYRTDNG